jgi:hypothetical protein
MARRLRQVEEGEGADEALPVRELLAVDEVRLRRMLMLRRMESQPPRRLLPEVLRKLPQAQRRPHVEPVQPVGPAAEVDVELRHQLLLVPVAHHRVVAWRTGLATERSPHASS